MTENEPQSLELRPVQNLSEIDRESWDALLGASDNPFLRWDFLEGLERHGCAVPERGWYPCHLTAWNGDELVIAVPAYLKNDGMGDFSRDWGFADLFRRAGATMYPKLILGVPFSPVTGRRLLYRSDLEPAAAARAVMALALELAKSNDLASVHVLYHTPEEVSWWDSAGLAPRTMIQYHWRNHGYETTDDWLARLKSKRRTQARRERREPQKQGIRIHTVRGDELAADPEGWADRAYDLYLTTCQKYMWGGAYLTRPFMKHLFRELPDATELVTASLDERIVAGAINIASPTHLYGRYWGCHEEHRFLHFNVCLYHSIDECIERGLDVFEGGAGGEHKMMRGFEPSLVHSSHWFAQRQIHELLDDALRQDCRARQRELEHWQEESTQKGLG
ncbi:MAG: GNAT family N-acetyltransferase [Acidobacteriota bacterium]